MSDKLPLHNNINAFRSSPIITWTITSVPKEYTSNEINEQKKVKYKQNKQLHPHEVNKHHYFKSKTR